MLKKLLYKINSGKNSKLKYYVLSVYRELFPKCLLRPFLAKKLEKIRKRDDYEYLMSRANYYCRLESPAQYDKEQWLKESVEVGKQPMTGQKVFYYDAMKYARWFSKTLRWILLPGDIYRDEPLPCVAKSRLLQAKNANITLFNMDYVRHFIFVNDHIPFSEKENKVIFRGGISRRNDQRLHFVKTFFNHPLFDIKVRDKAYPEWWGEKISIQAHLHCKFIMALEGNDVASNLKWVMSSNSIAVMPKPTCETWFMEGTLIPNYHYIEVKDDLSDLEERINYYIEHTDEAEAIVKHAHEYVEVFKNKGREDAIALLTLDKYFKAVNP
ncbi:glycosyl transferase family 90 [Hoylesella nanceiensis]|uniref:glycosyl transferase family 90 n=1 Tax=Hoylesella nanceiensis TaxID=425941 RepID=UPI0028EAB2F7|nr:glycosyl transferase family 90 [Hoylesella nanceiensis]